MIRRIKARKINSPSLNGKKHDIMGLQANHNAIQPGVSCHTTGGGNAIHPLVNWFALKNEKSNYTKTHSWEIA
jgi:hypothetical protein